MRSSGACGSTRFRRALKSSRRLSTGGGHWPAPGLMCDHERFANRTEADAQLHLPAPDALADHGDPALDLRLRPDQAGAWLGDRRATLGRFSRHRQRRRPGQAGSALRPRQARPRAVHQLDRTDLHGRFRHLLADQGGHSRQLRPAYASHDRAAVPDAAHLHPAGDWNGGVVGRAPKPGRRLRHSLRHDPLPRHSQFLAGDLGRRGSPGALGLCAAGTLCPALGGSRYEPAADDRPGGDRRAGWCSCPRPCRPFRDARSPTPGLRAHGLLQGPDRPRRDHPSRAAQTP